MLKRLIARAEQGGPRLAPFIGIGCPGVIEADGTIDRGAQNLPGNWESKPLPFAAQPARGDSQHRRARHDRSLCTMTRWCRA